MGLWQRILGKSEEPATGKRRWDGAAGGRRAHGLGQMGRINPEVAAAGPALRSRASYLALNSPFIANAVDNLVGALIGPGIQPAARHPDAEIRKQLNSYFAKWSATADSEGMTDWCGLQVGVARSLVVAGEAVVLIIDTSDGPKLRLVSADLIDDSKTVEVSSGVSIWNGVEIDNSTGKRLALWLFPEKPVQTYQTYTQSVRFGSESLLHVVKPVAAGQIRGTSWLAPIILPAAEFDALADALLTGAKVAALHAAFITNLNGTGEVYDGETPSMEPGAMVKLGVGEDVKFNSPQQAQQMGEFIRMNLRQLAAGLGVPTHLLDGDLSGANYSSLRAGLLPFRQRIEQTQFSVLVPQLLGPVWRAVILDGILRGNLDAKDFESNPEAYLQADWIPPAFMQVDPAKQVQADVAELEAGLTSRRKLIAARGYLIEDLDSEIAAEKGPANERN